MDGMFYETAAFNPDVGGWDTSKVTNMDGMFYEAAASNQDVGSWDLSQVTTIEDMFFEAVRFDQDLGWCIYRRPSTARMPSEIQRAGALYVARV